MTPTPIDIAHAAMAGAPDDAEARLSFYARLVESELFILLEREASQDDIVPRVADVGGHQYVLAFDREERLAEFAEGPAPYMAVSGRSLVEMLSAQTLGIALNVEVAPSAFLIPFDAVTWLSETLQVRPSFDLGHAQEVRAPSNIAQSVLVALDAKLPQMQGMTKFAILTAIRYEGGKERPLLAFVDALPGSEAALAQTVTEALVFAGEETASLDVAFFDATDPVLSRFAANGLRLEVPAPEVRSQGFPKTPGGDPDNPPILK